MRDRERERERQRHRQREQQAPRRESDVGLDPRSPGSGPGLKAALNPLGHQGCPDSAFLSGFQGRLMAVDPWTTCEQQEARGPPTHFWE